VLFHLTRRLVCSCCPATAFRKCECPGQRNGLRLRRPGGLMMSFRFLCTALGAAVFATAVQAEPNAASINFAVMRNGAQIGTNHIKVGHAGAETTVQNVTHVAVNIAFLTLYKHEQTETERWADGRFVAMNSKTDDNGTEHSASA